jgi:hypothetical protein
MLIKRLKRFTASHPSPPAVVVAVGTVVAASFALNVVNTVDKVRVPICFQPALVHAPQISVQYFMTHAPNAMVGPNPHSQDNPSHHQTHCHSHAHHPQIPVVSDFVELVGIAVTGWFTYRYLTVGPDRWDTYCFCMEAVTPEPILAFLIVYRLHLALATSSSFLACHCIMILPKSHFPVTCPINHAPLPPTPPGTSCL